MPIAIVLSGNQFNKVKRLLNALKVQSMSRQAHEKQLKKNGFPAIRHMAFAVEQQIVSGLRERKCALIIKGDAQADSPGNLNNLSLSSHF
jgi:hypothetical protein